MDGEVILLKNLITRSKEHDLINEEIHLNPFNKELTKEVLYEELGITFEEYLPNESNDASETDTASSTDQVDERITEPSTSLSLLENESENDISNNTSDETGQIGLENNICVDLENDDQTESLNGDFNIWQSPIVEKTISESLDKPIVDVSDKPTVKDVSFDSTDSKMSCDIESDDVSMMAVSPYACNICFKVYSTKHTLRRHKMIHTGERPFKCNVCSIAFLYKADLTRHRIVHAINPFTCGICKTSFIKKFELDKHIIFDHAEETPFSCFLCKKSFVYKSDLLKHFISHRIKKLFCCYICNKEFTQKSKLNVHIHEHLKAFSCGICNKYFANKSDLHNHIPVHFTETYETPLESPSNAD